MKKILVPTDFSELSVPSVHYAAMLALKMKCEIILLYVINISNSEMLLKRARLEEEIIELSKDDAERLIDEVRAKAGSDLKISFEYRIGHPVYKVIENYVSQHDVGLIVMGLHGATGLRKMLMGSNTSLVINNSSIPVIAVPPDATFHLDKIFYATDMSNLTEELNLLVGFAGFFDASIHVVHVSGEGHVDKEKVKQQISQVNYPGIYFHILRGDEVARILDTFVRRSKAHMLATFTHRLDFFEKLFNKSVTQELAAQNHLPLLTFNKANVRVRHFA